MQNLRRQYSRKFLRWARYFAGKVGAPFSAVGLHQFFEYESYGNRPADPSPYFRRLHGGRQMFNALQKEIRSGYLSESWQGFAGDLQRMPRWLFDAFYGWHPTAKERT